MQHPNKNYLWILFIISLSFSSHSTEFYLEEAADSILRKSVFKIEIQADLTLKHQFLHGTIFYIGNNRFVTNVHVAFPYLMPILFNDVMIRHKRFLVYNNKKLPFSKVLALDLLNDLAVLELDKESFKKIEKDLIPLKLLSSSESPSQLKGFAYGFPSFFQIQTFFSKITFKGYERSALDSDILFLNGNSANITGMSGGPILVGGKVIGVLFASLANNIQAISSEVLIDMLKKPTTTKNINYYYLKELAHLSNQFLKENKRIVHELGLFYKQYQVVNFLKELRKNILISRYLVRNSVEKTKNIMRTYNGSSDISDFDFANYLLSKGLKEEALEIYKDLTFKGFTPAINYMVIDAGKQEGLRDIYKIYKYLYIASLRGDGFSSYALGKGFEESNLLPQAEKLFLLALSQKYLPAAFKLIDFYQKQERLEDLNKIKKIIDTKHLKSKLLKAKAKYQEMEAIQTNNKMVTAEATEALTLDTLQQKQNNNLCLKEFSNL